MQLIRPDRSDLDAVIDAVGAEWNQLHGRRILITGCTGIIGKWLLATLQHAIDRHQLDTQAVLISRDPRQFLQSYAGLINDRHAVWLQGDVRDVQLARSLEIEWAIHGATDVVAYASALDLLQSCALGTQNVLQQLARAGCRRMLLLSSGAVYGKVPAAMEHIPESFVGGVSTTSAEAAYAEGKRFSELLCTVQGQALEMTIPIARCFAMVGPYLPLERHFAIGNFIHAALTDQAMRVRGDGRPVRSYLYLADVVTRLWMLLFRGQSCAYNVGSPDGLSILELAHTVRDVLGSSVPVLIESAQTHGVHADRYIPDIRRMQQALVLPPDLTLQESIRRTAHWYGWQVQ